MNTLHLALSLGTGHGIAECPWTTLPVGGLRVLQGCAGARLEVAGGRLWVTQPDDLDDHFLAAGESMRLGSDGPVVIESDGACAAVLRVRSTGSG